LASRQVPASKIEGSLFGMITSDEGFGRRSVAFVNINQRRYGAEGIGHDLFAGRSGLLVFALRQQ